MILLVHYHHTYPPEISRPLNVFDLSLYPEQIMEKQTHHCVGLRNGDKKLPVICIIIIGNYNPGVQIFLFFLIMILGSLPLVRSRYYITDWSISCFSACFYYLQNSSPYTWSRISLSPQAGDTRHFKLNICRMKCHKDPRLIEYIMRKYSIIF